MYKNEKKWALPFAAWELRLYLDTHPNDSKALTAYKQLCSAIGGGYACDALVQGNSCPLGFPAGVCGKPGENGCEKACDNAGSARWTWCDGPWPWQLEANISDCEG